MEVLRAVESGVVGRGGGEDDAQAVIIECGVWDQSCFLRQG